MTAARTIRIFISSPGDVAEERKKARRVIEDLERRYQQVNLLPVLWEDLALPATASFQETIDILLKEQPIDIAVFVLWSRLGSELGAAIRKPDGSTYRSGTEREFDLMLAAFEQSGRQRPLILAYAREDDAGFRQRLVESDHSDLEQIIAQRKMAEAFLREQFYDAEGHNVRAVLNYKEPTGFAQRLRTHLRQTLDELLGEDAGPRWHDDPYRGLRVFDVDHAPIFHGRDEETFDILQRLRDQMTTGCSFVVIVGASGSGKSSLARAGVAASLANDALPDGRAWRTAVLVPAVGAGGPVVELARILMAALPELTQAGVELDTLADGFMKDATLTVDLSIAPVFGRTEPGESDSSGPALLLILDQMEELWTDGRVSSADREQFLLIIEALARSAHVSVLATLRSDFYPQAQQDETFLRLKGERGHVDLLPPGPAALGQLITEPARLAGVGFEHDDATGQSLDEVILRDAVQAPGTLPLLQYVLDELWRQRSEAARRLTFAAYHELGGVEGALGKRAEDVFASLPREAQAALPEVLPLLITVDVAGDQTAVRQRARLSELQATPERETLVTSLIGSRFLTADVVRSDSVDDAIASFAHEALLLRWQRVADWVQANREYLRLRSRVEQSRRRWEDHRRDSSLLLPGGLPLEEGRELLRDASHLMTSDACDFVRASIDQFESRTRRARRRTRVVVSALTLLALLASIGGVIAIRQRAAADASRALAEKRHREAVANLELARQAVDSMLTEVGSEKLRNIPHLEDVRATLLSDALALYQLLQTRSADDPELRADAALAQHRVGDIFRIRAADGDKEAAAAAYGKAIEQWQKLTTEFPDNPEYARQLANSHNWLGELLRPSAEDYAAAKSAYESAIEIQQAAAYAMASDIGVQIELARSTYNRGILLSDSGRPGDSDAAVAAYRQAIAVLEMQLGSEGSPPDDLLQVRHELARCRNLLSIELKLQQDTNEAEAQLNRAISEFEQLVERSPNDRQLQLELAQCQNNRANLMLRMAGDSASAADRERHLQIARDSNAEARRLFAELARPLAVYQYELAGAANSGGVILETQGDDTDGQNRLQLHQQAIGIYQTAVDMLEPLARERSAYVRRLGIAICNLASLQQRTGQLAEARVTLERLSPELPFDGRRFRNAARIAAVCIHTDGQLADGCGPLALKMTTLAVDRYLADVESLSSTSDQKALLETARSQLSVVSEFETGSEFESVRQDASIRADFSRLTTRFREALQKRVPAAKFDP